MATKKTKKKSTDLETKPGAFTETVAEDVEDVSISEFLRVDNLKYMLYTIEDRAIPSIVDGMKPGQRRLLYSMYVDGVLPGAKTKKSARLVNNATGQFHPHGGAAMYGTLVNLAVPYRRVRLIEGIGSFGRAPGGVPAQDRYTEARLSEHGFQMVEELKDRPVPFHATYDGETDEPAYLSPQFPALTIAGAEGMAEAYRTNMPAHNPREIMELCQALLKKPKMTDEEIFEIVPGPDWATGGSIIGSQDEVFKYITTGRGKFTVRGTYEVDQKARKIIISEIPAGTTVPNIYEDIRDQARSGTLEGVKDVSNHSDKKHPIRLIIEGRRGADMEEIAKNILTQTKLETTFGASAVALTRDRVPRWWSLREQIEEFLSLRNEILINRSTGRLEKAKKDLMRSEALAKVLLDKEKAVKVVMDSADEQAAAEELSRVFDITQQQGEYVANLPIKRLSKGSVLDAQKNVDRLNALIEDLLDIITNEKRRKKEISAELKAVAKSFDDPHYDRKTQLRYDETPSTAKKSKEDAKSRLYSWKLDVDNGLLGDTGEEIPEGSFVWAAFRDGSVKLFDGSGLPKRMTTKTVAPDVSQLVSCGTLMPGQQDLVLVSTEGKVLRLSTDQESGKFNPQGIAGSGVAGMKLPDGAFIAGAAPITDTDVLLTISIDGWKVTPADKKNIPVKGRNGGGVGLHTLRKGDEGVYEIRVAPADPGFIINDKPVKPTKRSASTQKGHPIVQSFD